MGLDRVEIILETEERFGLAVSEEETAQLKAPSDLIDLTYSIVHRDSPEAPLNHRCLEGRAFHLLRQNFLKADLGSRKSFRPSAELGDLLPPSGRARAWEALGTEIDRWPPLGRTTGVLLAIAAIGLAAAYGTWAAIDRLLIPLLPEWCSLLHLNLLFAVAALVAIWTLLAHLTRPLRIAFPLHCSSVAAMCRYVAGSNHQTLLSEDESLTRSEIATIIKGIITEYCAPRDYSEKTPFHELGID